MSADLGAKGPCSISILEGLITGWNGLIGLDSVISLQIRVFYVFIGILANNIDFLGISWVSIGGN